MTLQLAALGTSEAHADDDVFLNLTRLVGCEARRCLDGELTRTKNSRSTTSTAVPRCRKPDTKQKARQSREVPQGLGPSYRSLPCPDRGATACSKHQAEPGISVLLSSATSRSHFRQRLTREGPLKSASGQLACSRLLVLCTDTQDNIRYTTIHSLPSPKPDFPNARTNRAR